MLITNNSKQKKKKGKVLFIDARKDLKREKTISYLLPEHISKIYRAYYDFKNIKKFSYVANISEIIKKEASLNVSLYVNNIDDEIILNTSDVYKQWIKSHSELNQSINKLFIDLKIK